MDKWMKGLGALLIVNILLTLLVAGIVLDTRREAKVVAETEATEVPAEEEGSNINVTTDNSQMDAALARVDENANLMRIYLYFVDEPELSDGVSDASCPGSVVPVETMMEMETGIELKALDIMLNWPSAYNDEFGLSNPLFGNSILREGSEWSEGKLTVRLSGALPPAEGCTANYIKEQIYQTLLQREYVDTVEVKINGVDLEDYYAN